MVDVSGVDLERAAQSICGNLQFESLETRGAAMADTILDTYSWLREVGHHEIHFKLLNSTRRTGILDGVLFYCTLVGSPS